LIYLGFLLHQIQIESFCIYASAAHTALIKIFCLWSFWDLQFNSVLFHDLISLRSQQSNAHKQWNITVR